MGNLIYRICRLGAGPSRAATLTNHLEFKRSLDSRFKYAGLPLASDERIMLGSIRLLKLDGLERADRFTALDPYEKFDLCTHKILHPTLQVARNNTEKLPAEAGA